MLFLIQLRLYELYITFFLKLGLLCRCSMLNYGKSVNIYIPGKLFNKYVQY